MNIKYLAGLMLASFFFVACDDNTEGIGSSLIGDNDRLEITTDTFNVSTRSIVADSVLSRNNIGYLGTVRDPESGAYMTSNFMTQFYSPEGFYLPAKDSIVSVINGDIVADSCDIRLYCNTHYGDSLAVMKLQAMELAKPMPEGKMYYSNFDPEKEGYINNGTTTINKTYTIADLNVDESSRKTDGYLPSIRIPLEKPYKGYNNFGTYLMHHYYEHPEDFKDAYTFIHNVVPGFYFKTKSGIGSLAYISLSQLNVYFRHKTTTTLSDGTKRDTIYSVTAAFPGTEEVLQTTKIVNDKEAIKHMVADNSCTYIKSPAGIYTEMTLPINGIMSGHDNDSINTAKVVLRRINQQQYGQYTLTPPTRLLLLPKADMYSFFENSKVADNKTSFVASFSKTDNSYTFNNIGSLVKYMHKYADDGNNDWNKVVIIPVTASYNSDGEMTNVVPDMSMSSVKLVGGSDSKYGDVRISVIYSKFKNK